MRLLALFLCFSAAVFAQPASHGYVFFAPGQFRAAGHGSTALHFGGGGEYVWPKSGFGAGAEMGIAGATSDYGDSVFGLFSINGYFHIGRGTSSKVDPYVTGGYSRSFGHHSGANWGNFGVGVSYWFRPKMAGQVEFRDHLHRVAGTTVQLWEIRLGLALR